MKKQMDIQLLYNGYKSSANSRLARACLSILLIDFAISWAKTGLLVQKLYFWFKHIKGFKIFISST